MFVLCKAHWVAIVYEMRYINKAALPNNQNLYAENEWDFHFRNHTVALYRAIVLLVFLHNRQITLL